MDSSSKTNEADSYSFFFFAVSFCEVFSEYILISDTYLIIHKPYFENF